MEEAANIAACRSFDSSAFREEPGWYQNKINNYNRISVAFGKRGRVVRYLLKYVSDRRIVDHDR